jgi:hypothetical protein
MDTLRGAIARWPLAASTLVPALVGALVLAISLTGCNLIGRGGEGPLKSETRTTTAFSQVEVSNGIRLTVQIGPTQSVEVRAQENILPVIATDIQGDTLRIHSTQGYTTSEGVTVTVVTPTLSGISMSGGSQGTATGLAADSLRIELSGGSALTASGSATTLSLNVRGGSRATLNELIAKTVVLDLSGGSNAQVNVSEQVSGSASGASRVTVTGGARINVESTGGSVVTSG